MNSSIITVTTCLLTDGSLQTSVTSTRSATLNPYRSGQNESSNIRSAPTSNSSSFPSSSSKRRRLDDGNKSDNHLPTSAAPQEPNEATRWLRTVNCFDFFFAVLLFTRATEYVQAEESSSSALRLWRALCERAAVDMPRGLILPVYDTAKEHFSVRAALVLEEARAVLSQQLALHWDPKKKSKHVGILCRSVLVDSKDDNRGRTTKVTFKRIQKAGEGEPWFTPKEKEYLAPGTIFQMIPSTERQLDNVILCVVVPCYPDRIHRQFEFDARVYHPRDKGDVSDSMRWVLCPIESPFLSLQRQYTACLDPHVGFLDSLMGKKPKRNVGSATAKVLTDRESSHTNLNPNQEKAARDFLEAEEGTITIVQGPPGTGKTSLLVSIMQRYFATRSPGRRRLLVCAPTNKAIYLLATRFLKQVTTEDNNDPAVNILVAGAEDNLFETNKRASPLWPHFMYGWLGIVIAEYRKMAEGNMTPVAMHERACSLQKRILRRLTHLPWDTKQKLQAVCQTVKNFKDNKRVSREMVRRGILGLIKDIKKLPLDTVCSQLVGSASVIFCTLCSAGGRYFSSTKAVDDLIVDEAAAATEPSLYIPFQMNPKRLLIVGDPLQLPATVISRPAKILGLDTSLHERLMYKCGFNYTQLDLQYRMHPEISIFPSKLFYQDRVSNGPNVENSLYGRGVNRIGEEPYRFFQTEGRPVKSICGSLVNEAEAQAVVHFVKQLRASSRDNEWHSADRLRIITFYKAQVSLIRGKLKAQGMDDVVVATVDSSQGCEADVVIISFVRGQGTAGFLVDDRRMNVALTRARHQLLCVGNVRAMAQLPWNAQTLRLLAEDARERNKIR